MHLEQLSHSNKLLDHLYIYHENISVRIYPNLGGSLQEFTLNRVKVIDGISGDENGLKDYKATYKSSILFPFPNRIEDGQYSYKSEKYQLELNEASLHNAIHGLVYNKSFTVKSAKIVNEKAIVVLSYESNGELIGFPFKFNLDLIYEISVKGELSLTFDITNSGAQSFPFGLGWHPYFYAENLNASTLSFPSRDFYSCNNRNIPVSPKASELNETFVLNQKTFDDAFSLEKGICIFEDEQYEMKMQFNSLNESYLQIYTPEHRKNIAIEPMTCIANAFNNKTGFSELPAGESFNWKINLFITTKS